MHSGCPWGCWKLGKCSVHLVLSHLHIASRLSTKLLTTLEMVPKLLRMVVGRIGGTKINRWACSLTKCNNQNNHRQSFADIGGGPQSKNLGWHSWRPTWSRRPFHLCRYRWGLEKYGNEVRTKIQMRFGKVWKWSLDKDTDEVWKSIEMKLGPRYIWGVEKYRNEARTKIQTRFGKVKRRSLTS